ncbi:hypothetical protein ACGF0K_33645 [Streptomyces sp. NPDC048156]|uniref:hypothetical protein n=1 Tax=Streptomyces sp. NPDC048156 TaxID=3365502 RepID=UPI00371CA5C1
MTRTGSKAYSRTSGRSPARERHRLGDQADPADDRGVDDELEGGAGAWGDGPGHGQHRQGGVRRDALGLREDVAKGALAAGSLGGAVARAFAQGVHFGSDLAVKDIALATGTTELPAMEAVLGHFEEAAADPALADEDIARAVARVRER